MYSSTLNLNLSKKEEFLLNRAVGVALTSQQKYRLGAVLVRKGKVISVGTNIRRNHPDVCDDPMSQSGICAERVAIKRAGTNAEGSTLYIARVGKCGDPLLAKPCSRCVEAIAKAKIKRVIFTM